ncbi:MAG TPA: GNAT family N-acetyltransferase, partial [Phnomibacter sp.]|nr:GNAT family N-acetyltransferase [Phnomibacter sp.]
MLPQAQGTGLGRQLALASLQFARQAGYQSLVLDTLERLKPALALYPSLGFTPIPAYYHNPLPGVVYLQKTLNT